jgi:transcription elongation factor GreA
MKKQFHLTKAGIDELKAELEELVAQHIEIADRIKTAREFGDLSENMEYTAARQEQERNEARTSEVEHILANVQVIAAPKTANKVVLARLRLIRWRAKFRTNRPLARLYWARKRARKWRSKLLPKRPFTSSKT